MIGATFSVLRMSLVFALMLIAGEVQAVSSPYKSNQTSASVTDTEQRGTEQHPLIIKALPVPRLADDVRREDAIESQRSESENLATFATLIVAAVTAILAYYTYKLWDANKTLVEGAARTAADQSSDTKASILEQTRATKAMEGIAKAMKENADLMSDMLSKQMRAYVAVNIGQAAYQDANNSFASYPEITNTGLSPAKNVSYRVMADILDTNLTRDYAFPEPAETFTNDATLSPRQTFTIKNAIVKERYDEQEVLTVMRGDKKRLFVWGTITYDDVFDGHWETKFCHHFMFYKVDGKEDVKVQSFYHTEHNSTT
jgi:hypothetical protein